jgi:hypothetical protein
MKNNCFCAFCRTPRRIYKKRRLAVLNIALCAVSATLVMYCLWRVFDPRVLMIFAVFLAMTETFIQLRWRMSVACRQCGFDPVLYVRDPDAASEKVTAHLKHRKQDVKYMLAKPLNLPTLSKAKSDALKSRDKKGALVSRQI